MLDEHNIIKFLQKHFPGQIGDDAAILPFSESASYVISKDLVLEEIHFRRHYQDGASLARKALHVNLSDIAAMGGNPQYVMLGIAIPENCEDYINDFLHHFVLEAKAANIELIGGDSTRSYNKLCISITIIGTCANNNLKFRNGAQDGDLICVAGKLGYAHLGLTALENSISDYNVFKDLFLNPAAKTEEGKWFGQQSAVTAMMDISDGLYIDLTRLCASSNKLAELDLAKLDNNREFTLACQTLGLDPVETALTGGEDYGLLLTIREADHMRIAAEFSSKFGYNLLTIGKIKHGGGVNLMQNGVVTDLKLQPFSHFGEFNK